MFRQRKHPVDSSWRVDETYVLVTGQWKYLYRAVDRLGQTVDFLLTAKRDEAAARHFFERAIELHDVPEKITIDKGSANTAAVRGLARDTGLPIGLRQSKHLSNLAEQGHRAIKRRTRPMMGFGCFHTTAKLTAGVETMHAIKEGQLGRHQGLVVSDADRFHSPATGFAPRPPLRQSPSRCMRASHAQRGMARLGGNVPAEFGIASITPAAMCLR